MKLRQFLLDRPLREVVVTYIASTWGGLEIIVTICELAGVSILVPQIVSLLIVTGLVLILGVRMIAKRTQVTQRPTKKWSLLTRSLVGFAVFFSLLPLSFAASGKGITWIMWQDVPILAISFALLAVLTFLGAFISTSRNTSGDA